QVFDTPNGDSSCVRRARSNTPLQALATLNEPLSIESARALAERALLRGGSTDEQRLAYAFRRCVARNPAHAETSELLTFLHKEIARRWFLQQCGVGLGAVALTSLLGETGLAAPDTGPADPLAPKKPPLVPKAKRVIFLFMAGAPSHLELFDYKPQLAKFDGTL